MVLFCQTGNGHIGIRQVHSFPAAQHTRVDDAHGHLIFFVGGKYPAFYFAIVYQDGIAGLHIFCKGGIGDIHLFIITEQFFGGDDEFCILLQRRKIFLHHPQPDLGSLQIGQDGNVCAKVLVDLPDQFYRLLVVGMIAVRHIQAEHIHPALYELADHLLIARCGSQGGNDLGSVIVSGHITIETGPYS